MTQSLTLKDKSIFELNGVSLIVIAITLFSIMGLGVKIIPNIPFYEIIFFRSIISAAICIFTAYQKRLPLFGHKKHLPLLIARGVFGTIGLCCFFYSIQNLNYSYAITLYQLAPLFILLMSAVIWKRRIHLIHWTAAFLAFAGIFWVYHTQIDSFDSVVTIGIVGAFFGGLAYQTIHLLKGKETPSVIVLFFPLVAIPISGGMLMYEWVQPTLFEWIALLAIGIITHMAQICLTKAYQKEEPAKLAIFNNLNVVLACMYSYFIFNETLARHQIEGLLIIVCGLVLSSVGDRWLASKIERRLAREAR